ncbi:hypothetical protein DPM19_30355 [Actinomadura craniellae]|uniref:Uncharacterized protein n=1 Tax=Actinomadura craniellae TaxID=2231787 RepID=A0A365GX39_9ACTN|nr:hypothetical protein [Actinomadura craniellae]RAY11328.1 hypothetical protein DPM19_30355 [Actinomadura craniellae]
MRCDAPIGEGAVPPSPEPAAGLYDSPGPLGAPAPESYAPAPPQDAPDRPAAAEDAAEATLTWSPSSSWSPGGGSPADSAPPAPSPGWAAGERWSAPPPREPLGAPPAPAAPAAPAWAQDSPARPELPPADAPGPQAWENDSESTQTWSMEQELQPTPPKPLPLPPEPAPAPRPPGESIVPDSWFAEPRDPGAASTQQWTPQPAPQQPWPDRDPGNPGQPWADRDPGQPWAPQPPQDGLPQNRTAVLNAGPPGMDPGFGPPMGPPMGAPPPYPAPGPQGRASKPLVIAVAALVAVAMLSVIIVLWPDGEGSAKADSTSPAANQATATPEPAANNSAARRQAAAFDALLRAGGASRAELGRALATARKCKTMPAALAGFQRVAQQRRQQMNKARTLEVSALANGTRLRSSLARSFELSLQTDLHFLKWAERNRRCRKQPKPDANYRRGQQVSAQTTVAKNQFVTLWNPVASKTGFPVRTANHF